MTAMIGAMIGASFHTGMFDHWAEWLVPLLGLVAFIAVAGGASYLYFRRIAGFDHATAYFAGMPGGVVEMVILGSERGGDERMIALVHSARIFLVVFSIPFIVSLLSGGSLGTDSKAFVTFASVELTDIGWFAGCVIGGCALGAALRFPARYLTGPLAISSALHYFSVTDFVLPTSAIAFAQVVIGASIGSRFASASPAAILRVMFLSVGSTVLLLTITMLFACSISAATDVPLAALVLAYSPGGIAEMSLVAVALHIEVPFVVLHHIARVLIVIAGATAAFRLTK
jgi:membrane AbrB-like protein